MKQNDKFICITFLVMIFAVLAFYPIIYVLISKQIITLDYNNFKEAPLKEGNSVVTKIENKISSLKTSIENRVTNYFPFYSNINYLHSDINYVLNKSVYRKHNFTFLGMNTDNEYVYRNDKFYILNSTVNDDILKEKFEKQLDFYQKLLTEKVELYVYLPNRYEFTDLQDSSITIRNKRKYINKLKEQSSDKFKVLELQVNNDQDYLNYFYKTDHHWNSYGAYQGYKDIATMMGFEPRKLNIVETNTKYYGSITKGTAQTDISDTFMYIDYQNNYDVTINGTSNLKYKPKIVKESSNLYYDYYVSFYNGMFGEVCFDYNNDKENLLIISDSYAWQIDEIIASHFNKTFVVNVRYDKFINDSLNYEEFVKKNNITKVLILQESATTLFDMYNYGTSRKILGE